MKALLLTSLAFVPLLLTACETAIVTPVPRRTAAVYVDRGYDRDYDRRYHRDRRSYRREVVVNPRPTYRPQVEVRYYNDSRGRYYMKSGRRVYVNSGVYY